tara:strand:+ start:76 stop:528 length:453 start_codon:yes stop_codon:yes gene_type:complete
MATLTVIVSESVTLSGKDQGDTTTMTFADIIDFYKRTIVVTPDTEVTLYSTHNSLIGGSTLDSDLVKYVRITNTDSTNFVSLRLINRNLDEFLYRLAAGSSFLLYAHGASVMNASEAAALVIVDGDSSIDYVKATANTGDCRLEIFAASA